jgi:hypothetical protein
MRRILTLLTVATILVGCGASTPGTEVGAPAEVLDLAKARKAVAAHPFVKWRALVEMTTDGKTRPLSDITYTFDHRRGVLDQLIEHAGGVAGKRAEMRNDNARLYLRMVGDETWEEFVIPPALRDKVADGPTSLIDAVARFGVTLSHDGSATVDGKEQTKYSGPLDVERFIAGMARSSPLLAQMKDQIGSIEGSGTVQVFVDRSGAPTQLVMDFTIKDDGKDARFHEVGTYTMLDAEPDIALPSASEVSRTESVTSADQLAKLIQEYVSARTASH